MAEITEKNPFTDEVDISASDPDNLVTGSGSHMFANEKLADVNPKVKELQAELERQKSQLLPIAKDILKKVAELRAEKTDIGSYLAELYAQEGKPKVKEKQVEIEFRARQL